MARPSSASKIEQLLSDVERNSGLGIVGAIDKVMAELEATGMAWPARIRPCQVGVDPSNRDGVGVNTEDVHSLGASILAMGWSDKQTSDAVCIQEEPGKTRIADFDKSLVGGNDTLPQHGFDPVMYGSVACSHTNMFLRCLVKGVECSDEDLSERGHMSIDKIGRRDEPMAKAARQGLGWKVLSYEVRQRYPKLLSLLQRARSAPQAVARCEHEVQCMLRMYQLAAQQQRDSLHPDWNAIRRSVASSNPPCASYLQEISIFVAVCGGGVEGAFIKDLCAFHRQFVDSKKVTIRGGFLSSVSEMGIEAPHLKIALVKAQYRSPPSKINAYCEPTSISTGDLSQLGKKDKDVALHAEAILRDVRAKLKDAGLDAVPHTKQTKILSRLDIMIARFVVGKQEANKADLVSTSLSSLAVTILQEAMALPGFRTLDVLKTASEEYKSKEKGDTLSPNLKEGHEKKSSKANQSDTVTVARMQEYNAGGELVDVLARIRAQGFDLGRSVVGTKNGVVIRGVVADSNNGFVSLRDLKTNALEQMGVDSFLESFTLDDTVEEKLFNNWPVDYLNSRAYLMHSVKTRISMALHAASVAAGGSFEKVNLVEEPKRTLRAREDIAKHALVIPYNSTKVHVKYSNEPRIDGEVCVDIDTSGFRAGPIRGARFVLASICSNELPMAVWAVRTTSVIQNANMVLTSMHVSNVLVAEAPKDSSGSTVKPATSTPPEQTKKAPPSVPKASRRTYVCADARTHVRTYTDRGCFGFAGFRIIWFLVVLAFEQVNLLVALLLVDHLRMYINLLVVGLAPEHPLMV